MVAALLAVIVALGVSVSNHSTSGTTPVPTPAPTTGPTPMPTPGPTVGPTPMTTPGPMHGCLSVRQVAQAWHSIDDPAAKDFCVAAVAVAVGESWGEGSCCNADATNGKQHGLWQISLPADTPEQQASVVWNKYTSDDQDYGCLASWNKKSAGVAHVPQPCCANHVFCQGAWTGDSEKGEGYYATGAPAVEAGGLDAFQAACDEAAPPRRVLLRAVPQGN